MASTDWDKELKKIDKQLESISDEQLFPAKPSAAPPAEKATVAAKRAETKTLGVFLRLALAVALGVGVLFWPYEARCGAGLALYLGATGVVALAGVWTSVWTWRHRAGRAHTLSLLLIVWGLVLSAIEVLPRTGYAKPSLAHPATWACK